MNRWNLLALTLLCASLAAVIVSALHIVRTDRAEALERFAQDRVEQVEQAARIIDEDLAHIEDDLRVAGQLSRTATNDEILGRELGALIEVMDHYRVIQVFDAEGKRTFSVGDIRPGGRDTNVEADMEAAARAARDRAEGDLFVSRPVTGLSSFRIFAYMLPATSTQPSVVVSCLVDTRSILDKLRLIAAAPGTHLLVIGPYGNPTPVSDSALSQIVAGVNLDDPKLSGYANLVRRMRLGGSGVVRVEREEAERLKLGNSDVFAAYASTLNKRGGSWAIATLRSAANLEAHDRVIVRRFGVAAGLVVLLILGFAAYVVTASRRTIADRERLKRLDQEQRLGAQLVRAEKLATVGVIAAGIAHEIGTPLAVVRGRAEYALGKLGPEHSLARGMNVIVEQIDLVSRTIRQLLDFSRVQPPATAAPVHVGEVARAVQELLRYEAERRKVKIALDVPEDLPAVAANPDELQQVVVNLVMNACHACRPGGHVHVTAQPEEPSPGGGAPRVRIAVVDDGNGIPPEHRAQVFDPFFTTKKRGQGTGLGLTIAAQIVRNHGGQIELESEPQRGSKVTLLWPAAPHSIEETHGSST
ncbi:MAG: ATP-binding protein [Byssovorax sp.]